MSLSNPIQPPIDDVGTNLDKYSYCHLFKIKEKLRQIKFKESLNLPPCVVLHPGRSFIKVVPIKNLVGKIGKPIGLFKTALAAWDYVGHGLDSASNLLKTWRFL